MIVVGGLYRERCSLPEWDQIFGSGGRGAAALALLAPGVELHAPCPSGFEMNAHIAMAGCGVSFTPSHSEELISFSYFHPLSIPEWNEVPRAKDLKVSGKVVLRYGMLEADAIVSADTAVYDPQSDGAKFRSNGSSAARLATVLNEVDACQLGNSDDPIAGVMALLSDGPDDIVVLKRGLWGAEVFQQGGLKHKIPVYQTENVFKIGSGDIFSAAFAFHWAMEQKKPEEAANLASRAVAHYVNGRTLPLPPLADYVHGPAVVRSALGKVYVAGPFFSLSQRWMVDEIARVFQDMGCPFFSPFHEVGLGDAREVATADILGLNDCTSVLAILDGGDPGTLFEVGHARSRGMPVICLAEDVHPRDVTMPLGTGCEITQDFCSAIYRAAWASLR